MSSFLRGRLRRLEQASQPPSCTIVLVDDPSVTDAELEAQVAAAWEMVGEDGTVIVWDRRDGVAQAPGPPTMRRPRPGEPGYIDLGEHLKDMDRRVPPDPNRVH